MVYNGNFNHELCTGSEDEDGDDAAEQVVIHRKGRALRKYDDNGKSKKKPRVVVVEVRFQKLALSCAYFCVYNFQ